MPGGAGYLPADELRCGAYANANANDNAHAYRNAYTHKGSITHPCAQHADAESDGIPSCRASQPLGVCDLDTYANGGVDRCANGNRDRNRNAPRNSRQYQSYRIRDGDR